LVGEARRRGAAVILDSNFLFIPLRFGVDIFEELRRLLGGPVRCIVPSPVIEELRLLRRGAKPKLGKEIDFALELADRCEIVGARVEADKTVDDAIVRIARLWRCPVATNDADLRRRLRSVGVPVIYLRQRTFLEVEGSI